MPNFNRVVVLILGLVAIALAPLAAVAEVPAEISAETSAETSALESTETSAPSESTGLESTDLESTEMPAPASMEMPATTNDVFLDELYAATAEYDALAHNFALEMGDGNIELAGMVCHLFDEGAPAMEGLSAIFTGISSGFYEGGADARFTADQIDAASFVYSVALVSFGTDTYCPEYTPDVVAALDELNS